MWGRKTSLISMVATITALLFWTLTATRSTKYITEIDKKWSYSVYQSSNLSNPLMVFFTRIGSGFFMVPLGMLLFFSYRKTNQPKQALYILWNTILIRILNYVLKKRFERNPPEWERQVKASKYGYPSAHGMNAAGFYGMLLVISGLWKNLWLLAGYIVLISMIGLSRVKLGIHFILDIISGLCSGILFNLFSVLVMKPHQRR